MTYQESITISAKGICDVVNVTEEVGQIVRKSKVREGIALVFVSGSTAGVTTIEYEPHLVKDLQELMDKLIPRDKTYHHEKAWHDDNGFSHLRAALLGPSVVVPISGGALQLGTWQQIVVIDFDNRPRERNVVVKVAGD